MKKSLVEPKKGHLERAKLNQGIHILRKANWNQEMDILRPKESRNENLEVNNIKYSLDSANGSSFVVVCILIT